MKCQICQQAEAVVHVKQAVNGQAREMHMCHGCAAKNGLDVQAPMGIADLLFGIDVQKAQGPAAAETACPDCGLKRSGFQKESRMGCATCYDTFADDLAPMLADMQKSGTHVGKSPVRTVLDAELNGLDAELKRAIETEDYEQAARLRDKIRNLRTPQNRAG